MKLIESLKEFKDVKISAHYTLRDFIEADKVNIRNDLFSGNKEALELLVATGLALDERSALPLIKRFELNQHNYLETIESIYEKNSIYEFYNSMSHEMMYRVTVIMTLAAYQCGDDLTRKQQFYLSNFSKSYEKMIKTLKEQIAENEYNYEAFIMHNLRDLNHLSATKRICDAALYFYIKNGEPMENEARGLNFPLHLLATDISNVIAALTKDTYLLLKEGAMDVAPELMEEMNGHLEDIGIARWKLKQKMPFYELFERYFIDIRIDAMENDNKPVMTYLLGNSETPVSIVPCRYLGCEFKYMEFVYIFCLANEMIIEIEMNSKDKNISFSEVILMTMTRVVERQQKIQQNKDYLTYRLLGKYQGVEVEIKNFQKEKRKVLAEVEKRAENEKQEWKREMDILRSELQSTKQELKAAIEQGKAEKSIDREYERVQQTLKEGLERVKQERDNLLKLNKEYENQTESAKEVNEIELPPKVVFVTAHPNLRNNIKERFGWETVDIEKINETSKLSGADLILYNSYSNAHTIFRKFNSDDLNKVVYTHGGTNLDIIEVLAKKGWKEKRSELLNSLE